MPFVEADDCFRLWCRWTTAKRLTSVLNVILILSDTQYKGWQPEKGDLVDIQMFQLYFVDRYGRISLKEAQRSEEGEKETDSYGSTSFENTPSPQSVPSMEYSTSGSSSVYPATESHSDIEEVVQIQTSLNTAAVDEVTDFAPSKSKPVPVQSKAMELSDSAVQPGLIPRKLGAGGPPPPDGRLFNDPRNLRTIMTGTGDGYRSPEPPFRLGTLPLPHYLHKDRPMLGGGPSGLSPSETLTGQLRPPFSVPQPTATQPSNSPGLGMEYGYGPLPTLSSSSVLPAKLMVYNDLIMDIGTAQYLGSEMREQTLPPPVNPLMPADDGGRIRDTSSSANWYQWHGVSHHALHERPQVMSSFGYPQPGQPSCGVAHISTQQTHTNFEGQWPPGVITDFG